MTELDKDIKIFFPGINQEDLKNTTNQEKYIKKNIKDILCYHISKDTKINKFMENKIKIKELLKKNVPGKEEQKMLFEKILKMSLLEVLVEYLADNKDFIIGYRFKTFIDDLYNYDVDVQNAFKDKAFKLIKGLIPKRNKKSK